MAPRQFSLRTAANHLLSHLETVSIPRDDAPATRLTVCIAAPPAGLLAWLRQHVCPQKLFFRARDRQFEVAALGFAHLATGPLFTSDVQLRLARILHPAHPAMRFYGARRFDDDPDAQRDPLWRPYQGYVFVLPAVEIYRDHSGVHFLACNIPDLASVQLIRPLLSRIATTSPAHSAPPLMLPRAAHTADLTTFRRWDSSISTILSQLSANLYDKIVLARRKRFTFHPNAAPNPFQILAALDEPASPATRSTYLFCIQLDHQSAFLGCTPERLFHLEGRNILTEALAATVRRSTDGDESDLLSELLGQKNLEEHRFVVDYIRTALSDCGVQPETNGPHVRRLPRLMHLATDIRGQFPVANPASNSSETMLYRLLSAMHPTPAVCGLPREFTKRQLSTFEDFDRGLFAGPLGWFSRHDGEFCVAIRSALMHGDCVTAFAGSGIVQASESKSEWDETELKMSAFIDMFQDTQQLPNDAIANREHGDNSSFGAMDKRQNGFTDHAIQDQAYERTDNIPDLRNTVRSNLPSDRQFDHSPPYRSTLQAPSPYMNSFAIDSPINISPDVIPSEKFQGYFDPSKLSEMPNLNALWGCCCVEELCRNGVNTFFISPGSRSAPLAIGAVKSRHAKIHIAHDERGAGFLAVGYARATKRAAAVITSSGTAVANLLPAVVEASMDSIPMIILTADRPPELRDIGANQAIHQPGIFSVYTRWFKDFPCPSNEIPLRNLLSDIDYGVQKSGSSHSHHLVCSGPVSRGPVHLNMMFREKLCPDPQPWDRSCIASVGARWQHSLQPLTSYSSYAAEHENTAIFDAGCLRRSAGMGNVFDKLRSRKAGLIIVGGGNGCVQNIDDALAVCEIAEWLNWPILSDICGGLRFANCSSKIVHYADQIYSSQLVLKQLIPDAVLQFGERITSKRICKMMSVASRLPREEEFLHVLVSDGTQRSDPLHTVTHRIFATISDVLYEAQLSPLSQEGDSEREDNPLCVLTEISEKVGSHFAGMMSSVEEDALVEPWCARAISEALVQPSALFVGNSMPIRDFDAFGSRRKDGLHCKVDGNRGASGIDGIISSGIGYGIGLALPVTIVLGDMSMLHDLNALHVLREGNTSECTAVTIVVVNNSGGGIFSMLPVAKYRQVFTPVFNTPHQVSFKHVCDTFGLKYHAAYTVDDVRKAASCVTGEHRLIEAFVPRDHATNAALHRRLEAAVLQQVSTILTKN